MIYAADIYAQVSRNVQTGKKGKTETKKIVNL
jgi:hypothetical protein